MQNDEIVHDLLSVNKKFVTGTFSFNKSRCILPSHYFVHNFQIIICNLLTSYLLGIILNLKFRDWMSNHIDSLSPSGSTGCKNLLLLTMVLGKLTRGPRATIRSPEWHSHCRHPDVMQHFASPIIATNENIIIWTVLSFEEEYMSLTVNGAWSFE